MTGNRLYLVKQFLAEVYFCDWIGLASDCGCWANCECRQRTAVWLLWLPGNAVLGMDSGSLSPLWLQRSGWVVMLYLLCICVYLLHKYVLDAYYVLKISLWSRGAPWDPIFECVSVFMDWGGDILSDSVVWALKKILVFPCGSGGKESTCNVGDLRLIPGLGRFPWRRERLPTPVFWPGEFCGLHSPWGRKEWTWLSHFHWALKISVPQRKFMGPRVIFWLFLLLN